MERQKSDGAAEIAVDDGMAAALAQQAQFVKAPAGQPQGRRDSRRIQKVSRRMWQVSRHILQRAI